MNKKSEGVIIWIVLAGALFFALRLPFVVYGGMPEIHDDILQPRYTATLLSTERAMTQQAFAMMFFTPTFTAEPTKPFLAFLLPNTGATSTLTATFTNTATLSATPTRTLLPVFMTQTRVSDGGGGPFPGSSVTPTKTPFVTLTTVVTSPGNPTASNTVEPTLSPTNVPIDTDTPAPTETDTPKPANTNKPPTKTEPPPTATDAPPPTATDAPPPTATDAPPPTDPPPDTETPQAFLPDGLATVASAPSVNMMPFIMFYLLGGTFLGVVFRKR